MKTQNDEQLVHQAQAGNTDAFGALIQRHFGLVFTVALARLANREAAEDLAQEVFLQLFLRIQTLRSGAQFPNWAARATRNLATDWHRRSQTRSRLITLISETEEMATPEKGAPERITDTETHQALTRALNDLTPDQREVLLLHCVNGLTKRDIAIRLGVHPTTVGRQIDQSLTQLREIMTTLTENPPATLLPTTNALQRTLTLSATTLALSSTTRAAILSSPPIVEATKAIGAATTSLGTGTLKSIAAKAAGGIMMGKSTITVVGVMFAVIAGGMYLQHDQKPKPDPIAGVSIEIRELQIKAGSSASRIFRAKGSFLTKRKSDDRITTDGVYTVDVEQGNKPLKGTLKDTEKSVDLSLAVPPDITTEPITIRLERKLPYIQSTNQNSDELAGFEFQIQQDLGFSFKQYNITSNLLMKSKSDGKITTTPGPHVLVEQGQNATFDIKGKDGAGPDIHQDVAIAPNPPSLSITMHMELK